MRKNQIVIGLGQKEKDNLMCCSLCGHEAKRHTPIGCDHVISATRHYGYRNVVSVDFCDCSLTFEEVLK
jgi:hypothetical protein